MKWSLLTMLLLLYVRELSAFKTPVYDRNGVVYYRCGNLASLDCYSVTIKAWCKDSLLTPAEIDTLFSRIRGEVNGIVLNISDCQSTDSACVKEVLGRFTPFKLGAISPTGPWQWDKPLVVVLSDSLACPLVWILAERRWTEIMVVDNGAQWHADQMAKRYKRERVDRLEDMFRK